MGSHFACLRAEGRVLHAGPNQIDPIAVGGDTIVDDLAVASVELAPLDANVVSWPVDRTDASYDQIEEKFGLRETLKNGCGVDAVIPNETVARIVDASEDL